jgi:hypothetical protein
MIENFDVTKCCEDLVYAALKKTHFGLSGHNLLWIFSKRDYNSHIMEGFREVTSMSHTFRDKRIVRHKPILDGKEGVANILRVA